VRAVAMSRPARNFLLTFIGSFLLGIRDVSCGSGKIPRRQSRQGGGDVPEA
jgi:hypothetical protein